MFKRQTSKLVAGDQSKLQKVTSIATLTQILAETTNAEIEGNCNFSDSKRQCTKCKAELFPAVRAEPCAICQMDLCIICSTQQCDHIATRALQTCYLPRESTSASAIVSRDANGNFTEASITGSLDLATTGGTLNGNLGTSVLLNKLLKY